MSIIAYHGTKKEAVFAIEQNGFEFKPREDHWLGDGFYFYELEELAKWWANRNFSNNNPTVLQVEIKVERILDLDKPSCMSFLQQSFIEIYNALKIKPKLTSDNKFYNLCYMINMVKKRHDFAVVAKTFVKHKHGELYSSFHIETFENQYFPLPIEFCQVERQICVSPEYKQSIHIIKKTFLPNKNRRTW